MGMFDTVLVKCKNRDCDEMLEFQSKAGPCVCKTYNIDEVPLSIAENMDGEVERCPKCQCETTIYLPLSVPKFVQMKTR